MTKLETNVQFFEDWFDLIVSLAPDGSTHVVISDGAVESYHPNRRSGLRAWSVANEGAILKPLAPQQPVVVPGNYLPR